jgi:hypothetical protein
MRPVSLCVARAYRISIGLLGKPPPPPSPASERGAGVGADTSARG